MDKQKATIAVDANPLLATLLGGKARAVLFSRKFIFITTEHTVGEVEKYLPKFSVQIGIPESELFSAFHRFPITAIHPSLYDEMRKQAEELIAHRDPKDVDILALALKFDAPIWTEDKDFENIPETQVLTTADMLEKLAALMP